MNVMPAERNGTKSVTGVVVNETPPTCADSLRVSVVTGALVGDEGETDADATTGRGVAVEDGAGASAVCVA